MPIYCPDDYEEVIARIRKKTAEKNIKLGERLLEKEISDFEKSCNIRLPSAYRMFLKHVGDGCESMIDGFPLNKLSQFKTQDLSRPFMPEKAWIWENDPRPSEIITNEIENGVYQGEIELIDIGCSMSYNLIVSGKCTGEVWCFSDVGIQPCCERQDFLGWFELWLDNQDETDYFKDYIYE